VYVYMGPRCGSQLSGTGGQPPGLHKVVFDPCSPPGRPFALLGAPCKSLSECCVVKGVFLKIDMEHSKIIFGLGLYST
jgi:hypothetical protein